MADKKKTKATKSANKKKTDENKLRKILILVGSAVAVLAIALFLIFNDGLPKNVKEAAESTIEMQLGCKVSSLKSQKRYKVKDSEHDKEVIYLATGVLKGRGKFASGYRVAVLVAEIENDGEEKVVCKTVAMDPERSELNKKIKEIKKNPDSWSDEIERLNSLV